MLVHPEPRPARDLVNDRAEAGIVDLARPAAPGAHDMMMVGSLAGHVGVVATREIDSLDATHRFKSLESPEDRGPADAEPA